MLVTAVALVNLTFPALPLTAAIAVTVATIVLSIAALAAVLTRRASPLARLGKRRAARSRPRTPSSPFSGLPASSYSLSESPWRPRTARRISLALPTVLVAPALALIMGVGFVAGIHVIPMVLLLNTAFPLDGGPAPALWAAALLLGAQSTLLPPCFPAPSPCSRG